MFHRWKPAALAIVFITMKRTEGMKRKEGITQVRKKRTIPTQEKKGVNQTK